MSNLLIVAAGVVFVVSGYWDIRFRILPDSASVILLVLALIRWCWPGDWYNLGWSFACALGIFVVSAAAFARGWLGGGDVKLISAASFFLGVESLVPFIVYTAIAGGGLSLIVLLRLLISRIAGFWGPGVDGAEAGAVEATVPYGAAIALAGLYILYVQFRVGVN